jgi:uncharacterized SAM-binding protein YcdF (DUF218 family)
LIETLLSVLKPIDAPGSTQFLLLCLLAGLTLGFWPRHRRLARRWMVTVVAVYIVLALPITARAIAGARPATSRIAADAAGPLAALIVFDGDNRRGRITAAATAFWYSHPAVIWVVGGDADWLYDKMPDAGIPPAVRRLDSGPRNTRDQIAWVSRYVSANAGRAAVISSRLQLPRIAGLFREAGLDVPLIAAPIDTEPPVAGWQLFVPRYIALRVSRDALYEHMALAYYRHNGWLR